MKKLYMILIILLFIPTIVMSGELPQTVFISGIENGMCLVPNVNLWNKPGGLHIGAKVITTVKGCVGLPVKIIETERVGIRVWYHVKTFGINKGKSGWVTDSFIGH